jgi:hypothetical protein
MISDDYIPMETDKCELVDTPLTYGSLSYTFVGLSVLHVVGIEGK